MNADAKFAVKGDRIHRTTCKRVNLDATRLVTATEALTGPSLKDATPATCCKPQQSAEWKAAVAAVNGKDEPAPLSAEERKAADADRKSRQRAILDKHAARVQPKGPADTGGTESRRAPRSKATGEVVTDEAVKAASKVAKAAAKAAAAVAADPGTVTPETPHGTTRVTKAQPARRGDAPEPGEVEDMGGKKVRAAGTTVAYVSRTHRKTGSGYLRMEWVTDGGTTIVWTWPHGWTLTRNNSTADADVKNLGEAVTLAVQTETAEAKMTKHAD